MLALDAANAGRPRRASSGRRTRSWPPRRGRHRDALLQEGRRLFEAGRYEDAQRPLAEAASDKDATEAQDLLAKARKYVEGVRQAKETRTRVDQLLAEAEGLMGERRYADASVRFGSVLALEPDNTRARERQRMALRLTGEELFDKSFPNAPPVLNFLLPERRR